MDSNKQNDIERAAESLKKEYVMVGKSHVRAWHTWLGLGVVAGLVAGVFYVANRTGTFEGILAAQGNFNIIQPNGGENWLLGSSQIIKWHATRKSLPTSIFLADGNNAAIEWHLLDTVGNKKNLDNSINWIVGQGTPFTDITSGPILPGTYYIAVCQHSGAEYINCDYSNKQFTIL